MLTLNVFDANNEKQSKEQFELMKKNSILEKEDDTSENHVLATPHFPNVQ